MGGYGVTIVAITIHLAVYTRCQGPDISPQLTITSMTTESLGVSWTFDGDDIPEIRRVYISALYVGPCDNPLTPLPPVAVLTTPIPDSYIVTDLEDFSTYAVNVTVEAEEAREESTVHGTTVGIGPSSQATELTLRGSLLTGLTMMWAPIPCHDRHSRLEEFTLTATPLPPAQDSGIRTLSVFATVTSGTILNLIPDTQYNITLSAAYTTSSGDGVKVGSVAETITGTTFPIPGPWNLQAMATETVLSMSWLQEVFSDDLGLTGYEVAIQYIGPCPSISHNIEDTIPISSQVYVFENLTEFGTYGVSVTAVSMAGERATSRVTMSTLPIAPQAPPTLQVTDIQAFSVSLTWEPLDCVDKKSDITEYVLYYGPTEQYLQEPGGRFNITTDVANTTASIEVTPLTMYTFQVVAVNREGLVSPPSLLINTTTLPPPPPPDNLTVDSIEATSAVFSWTLTPNTSYYLVVRFTGPCMDVVVPTHTILVEGGASNVTDLEESSTYVVMVTPQGGRSPANTTFTTLSADPTPPDDHVQNVSSTNSTVVFQIPPISCIDLNGQQVQFRMLYAASADFANESDVRIRSGMFRPGVVIVGNLELATEYTFQVILLVEDGGNVSLVPITVRTLGTQVTTSDIATPPTQDTQPAPGLSTGVIAAIVVVVIGVTTSIVIAIAVVACVVVVKMYKRRERKKTDEEILTEKEEVVGTMLKNAAKKEAAKKEAAKKEAARKEAVKKEAAKKKSLSKRAKESRKVTQLLNLSDWNKSSGRSKPNPIANPTLEMPTWAAKSPTKTLDDWTSMLASPGSNDNLDDWLSTSTAVSTLQDSSKDPGFSTHRMDWMKNFGASPTSTMYADDDDFCDDDFNFAEEVISSDGYQT